MLTKIVEVTTDGGDYGCFIVQQLDPDELAQRSHLGAQGALLPGYGPADFFIFDARTREGAVFTLHKSALLEADLRRRPFAHSGALLPFLRWLKAYAAGFIKGFSLELLPAWIRDLPAEPASRTNPPGERSS